MSLKTASRSIYARTSVLKNTKFLNFIYARTSGFENTKFLAPDSKI